jgi:hypothetical protein
MRWYLRDETIKLGGFTLDYWIFSSEGQDEGLVY